MDGVERVQQIDYKTLHWKADIAGVTREWTAEIVHQEPDQQISWRSTDGTKNEGTVAFASIGTDRTQVTLRLDFEPEGAVEKGRRQAAPSRSAGCNGPGEVQGLHRASRGRDRRLARQRATDR